MIDVFKELVRVFSEGGACALATVISRQGPTPMAAEAKMLIRADGKIVGTVGGGCTEAQVQSEGKRCLLDGLARSLSFTLTRKEAGEEGHICGGRVQFFIEPVTENTVRCAAEAVCLSEGGRPAAVASLVFRDGPKGMGPESKMVIRGDGTIFGSLGNGLLNERAVEEGLKVIDSQVPELVTLEAGQEVFIEPVPVVPTVCIFGAGHVSFFLAKMAKLVGFRVVVVDDRSQFANRERFPEADEVIVDDFEVVGQKLPIDRWSYLVIVTRGHLHDSEVLEWAVFSKARYIGMIGSRAKVRILFRDMESKGVAKELLARVHAPIGLDIKAETPEEIAVSVVAEMVLTKRQKEPTSGEIRSKKVVPHPGPAAWA